MGVIYSSIIHCQTKAVAVTCTLLRSYLLAEYVNKDVLIQKSKHYIKLTVIPNKAYIVVIS